MLLSLINHSEKKHKLLLFPFYEKKNGFLLNDLLKMNSGSSPLPFVSPSSLPVSLPHPPTFDPSPLQIQRLSVSRID